MSLVQIGDRQCWVISTRKRMFFCSEVFCHRKGARASVCYRSGKRKNAGKAAFSFANEELVMSVILVVMLMLVDLGYFAAATADEGPDDCSNHAYPVNSGRHQI